MKCTNCGNENDSGKELCIYCGSRLPIVLSQQDAPGGLLPAGTLLRGRYEITQETPSIHGMGIVYFAIDRQAESKPCVVKQVKEEVVSNEVLQKLEGEAKRMAALSQSIGGRLPEILEAFVENKKFFVVQQRIHGKNLEDIYNERSPLSEAEVTGWAIQCCKILQLIHNSDQLHRDISPDNLMLTPASDIVFIDFGTLRELKRIARGTAGAGKFGFAPLEQWQQKPCKQSDIFALGATVYNLLSGYLPLSNELKSGKDPTRGDFEPVYPPIRQINPNISPGLEAVLIRALKLSPDERYHSAEAMQTDLGKLQNQNNTVRCTKCGHENNAAYIYCEKCQKQLYSGVRRCPKCNRQVPASAIFCIKCGIKMP